MKNIREELIERIENIQWVDSQGRIPLLYGGERDGSIIETEDAIRLATLATYYHEGDFYSNAINNIDTHMIPYDTNEMWHMIVERNLDNQVIYDEFDKDRLMNDALTNHFMSIYYKNEENIAERYLYFHLIEDKSEISYEQLANILDEIKKGNITSIDEVKEVVIDSIYTRLDKVIERAQDKASENLVVSKREKEEQKNRDEIEGEGKDPIEKAMKKIKARVLGL